MNNFIKTYFSISIFRLFSILVSLLFIALVTIIIPATEFGKYSLLLSIIQLVGAAFLSWPNLALVKYGREEYIYYDTVGETLFARLLIHLFLIILCFLCLLSLISILESWLSIKYSDFFPLLIITLILFSINEMGNSVAQITEKFTGFSVGPLIFRLAQLSGVSIIYFGLTATWKVLIISCLVGYTLSSLIIWMQIPKKTYGRFSYNIKPVKNILSFSWSLPLVSLSSYVLVWVDIWFIKYFLDLESVGIYAWAFNVYLLAMTLFVPISAILTPKVIEYKARENIKSIKKYLYIASSVLAFSFSLMPLFLGVFILLSNFVYLGSYSSAVYPMLILLAVTAFQFGMALMSPVVFAHKEMVPKIALIMLGMALINVFGDFILIPSFGISGAAISTAIAFIFGMSTQWMMVKRHINIESNFYPKTLTCLGALTVLLGVVLEGSVSIISLPILVISAALLFYYSRKKNILSNIVEVQNILPQKTPKLINLILIWISGRSISKNNI